MHQTPVLRCHRQQNLLERVRVIVDQGEHAAESVDEVVEEPAIDVGLDAVDEEGQTSRERGQGASPGRCARRSATLGAFTTGAGGGGEGPTVFQLLSAALPYLLGWVALAHDRVLLAIQA